MSVGFFNYRRVGYVNSERRGGGAANTQTLCIMGRALNKHDVAL